MPENRILEGVRVLTLEQVHALPWGTSFLADQGAQVIRVESVVHLQDRKSGPFPGGKPSEEWWNEGGNLAYFGARNKQSLCLEVADPRGKEIFLKLVQECDIVTDNFRPGTMARYGFDHESLSKLNPRIITLSSTAFGYTGSWSRAGSRARTVDASCGMSYLTGYEDGPSRRASNNYMDHSVGNNVAYALLLAVRGETYENALKERKKDLFIGAIALIYAIWLLYAGGTKYLLLSALLYAPGAILFAKAKRELGKPIFTNVEKLIFAAVVIGAFVAGYGLYSGFLTL